MNMNKKLLAMALATLLATPTLYAVRTVDNAVNTGTTNDDADDLQTVNITVPEVALLDVADADVALNIADITDAGTGFAAVTETTSYALSSNVASSSNTISTARTLDVGITDGSLPVGAKLTIVSSGSATTGTDIGHIGSPTALEDGTTGASLASGITNVTMTNGVLSYTLEPTQTDGMMSFTGANGTTADNITLTYTLSADI